MTDNLTPGEAALRLGDRIKALVAERDTLQAKLDAAGQINTQAIQALMAKLNALRRDELRIAAQALLADARAHAKWTSAWDRGFVAGVEHAANVVANSIDRPEDFAAIRDTYQAGEGD